MLSEQNKLIINADDFGASASINAAIVESFRQGWITHASLMANLPAFDQACELIEQHGLQGRIGAHLNLSRGAPLTPAIRQVAWLCGPDGKFLGQRRHRLWLAPAERWALTEELAAQIRACLTCGGTLTHLDMHHHYHYIWPICSILLRLAGQFHVPAIRIHRNFGVAIGPASWIYTRVFNARLRLRHLARSDWFLHLDDVLALGAPAQGSVEIMVHPDLNSQNVVMDGARAAASSAPLLKECMPDIVARHAASCCRPGALTGRN